MLESHTWKRSTAPLAHMDAWLEASGPDSWRIYERIGYRPTGKRLYISQP